MTILLTAYEINFFKDISLQTADKGNLENYLIEIFAFACKDGKESNKSFVTENMFGGPLAAFALNLPLLYGMQALEPTKLLVARYADFVALFDEHPIFDRLGRKLAEWLLVRKELRERSFLQQGAKDRYLDSCTTTQI